MFIKDYLEHLVAIGVPAEKVRTLRSSHLYNQLSEFYVNVEAVIEAAINGTDEVIFKNQKFRVDEYHIPSIFLNQLKFANVYINADDIFDVSVKSLFSLSLSSKEFSKEVGMHPAQFNKFMEELASFNALFKPSEWKYGSVFVASVAELGRVLTRDGDFKISDSNVYLWLGLFENFVIGNQLSSYCKRIPPLVGEYGAFYELDRIVE